MNNPNVLLLGPAVELQEKYANAQIGFHAAFIDYLEKVSTDPMLALAMEMPSTTALEQHIFIGDVPGFAEWVGDREMGSLQAHNIQVKNRDWSSGISIHRNQIADDKLGLVYPSIQRLAKRAKRHPGQLLAKLFMNGFTGNSFPEVGDGTDVRRLAVLRRQPPARGRAGAVEPARQRAARRRGPRAGLPADARVLDLRRTRSARGRADAPARRTQARVHGEAPRRADAARSVPGDDRGGVNAQSGADTNIHYGQLEVIVSQRLRDYGGGKDFSTAWGLLALDEPVKPFLFQTREPISDGRAGRLELDDMFKRGRMNFGAQARYNVANYDWRLAVGSRGA
jgi:phage major head subunit gpT-like protein